MFKHLSPIAALALAAMTFPALAQETETTDDTTATEDAAPVTSPQLDLGQAVTEGPKLGERYSKEKIGDWDLACIRTEAETDPCSLLQVMRDDTGNPVAEISLFRIENGGQAAAGATILVPLETLLPAQLTIAVDDAPGKRYNYTYCSPIGCAAQIGLTQEDIDTFKKGNKATVSLVPAPAPDQVVTLTLSLKGFTAGFDAVDVVKQ
ncbi:invasion associated locus B family protein [Sedimentitalea todarodis]|uniref:Invasion associated locus B family protein n=1 Tax=Sedimentitalea todarodis TaxID=1631240 RepID=A0ABU3VB35_9RHOB|nr:invasion associated locus B family protein [Sedimentitalea todarodis]MDU9003283.1 invasion associated locus B family protein [Sedimentitalea todarodis]